MDRELRKHPRIPTNENCSLRFVESDHQIDATTFCIATHGLGISLVDPRRGIYAVGENVKVVISVDGESTELCGTLAWARRAQSHTIHIGIRLDLVHVVPPSSYLRWVEQRYITLRTQSLELGSELAFQRKISLRTYQDALDLQARDGGHLEEHLRQLSAG